MKFTKKARTRNHHLLSAEELLTLEQDPALKVALESDGNKMKLSFAAHMGTC